MCRFTAYRDNQFDSNDDDDANAKASPVWTSKIIPCHRHHRRDPAMSHGYSIIQSFNIDRIPSIRPPTHHHHRDTLTWHGDSDELSYGIYGIMWNNNMQFDMTMTNHICNIKFNLHSEHNLWCQLLGFLSTYHTRASYLCSCWSHSFLPSYYEKTQGLQIPGEGEPS